MNEEFPTYMQNFKTFFGTKISCLLREGTSDHSTIASITIEDEYNLKAVPFNDGDIVLDLGAHIGGLSLLLASLNRNLTIYAYEPLPENVELLKKNAESNGFSNIFAYQLAVSDKNEKVRIYYGDPATEIGRIHYFIGGACPSKLLTDRYVEADTITLEQIFSEHGIERCKLIKSDIEGNELNIFKSCPYDVLKRIDYFVGEHHDATRKELLSHTRGLFEDMPCKIQNDGNFGNFWFRKVRTSYTGL